VQKGNAREEAFILCYPDDALSRPKQVAPYS
jgi:hypothetical protein